MPVVLVPAGASLAAFIVAVFSWYGTLRNGIQLMHNDIHAIDTYDIDLRSMDEDIAEVQRRLLEWQRQWFVYDFTPELLHVSLWGQDRTSFIRAKLNSLVEYCNKADKSLRPFTKPTNTMWKPKPWRKIGRAYLKMRFIATKKAFLLEVIKRLKEDLIDVRIAAENGFQKNRSLKGQVMDFRKVYHAAVSYLLIPVAMFAQEDANRLQQLCCPDALQQGINLHLDLDIFRSTGSILDISDAESSGASFAAIAQSAESQQLKWRFLVSKDNTEFVRMGVERANQPVDNCKDFSLVCGLALKGREGHFRVFNKQFRGFHIPGIAGMGPRPARALRQLLLENEYDWYNTKQHPLSEISRSRVVFELSQACMLFLRTSWLSEVCNCGIQYRPSHSGLSRQQLFEFEVSMGPVTKHTERCVAVTQGGVRNGTESSGNTLTRAMRRVGLLMVESILGFPITRIEIDEEHQVTGIEFFEAQRTTVFRSIDVVMQQINIIFHQDDAPTRAINQCLTTVLPESPTDENMRRILAEFYHGVVAHLNDHYHELLTSQREHYQNIELTVEGPSAG